MAHIQAGLMAYGYVMDEKLINAVGSLGELGMVEFFHETVEIIKKVKGGNATGVRPFYPNFATTVREAPYINFILDQVVHYLTEFQWLPESEEFLRSRGVEPSAVTVLTRATKRNISDLVEGVLFTKGSLSAEDLELVDLIVKDEKLISPYIGSEKIVYREVKSRVVAHNLSPESLKLLDTTTDILRVIELASGGDGSLTDPTIRFRHFRRSERKMILARLEQVIKLEDIRRHLEKWKIIFNHFHVGEYKQFPEVQEAAEAVRAGNRIVTFGSLVEEAIHQGEKVNASIILKQRPGEFARRLDKLLRMRDQGVLRWHETTAVIENFLQVAHRVPRRILWNLLSFYLDPKARTRPMTVPYRRTGRYMSIPREEVVELADNDVKHIIDVIRRGIIKSMASETNQFLDVQRIYIDPSVNGFPIPRDMRSTNSSTLQLVRGTRLPLVTDICEDGHEVLRFFAYWKGEFVDIDLSAVFLDEHMHSVSHISYSNLRNNVAVHSGDVRSAPNGATEFIDIDIDSVTDEYPDVRYISLNLYNYSGEPFNTLEESFCGWMIRKNSEINEIFDPKTVKMCSDVKSTAQNVTLALIDIKAMEVIWVDTSMEDGNWRQFNVESQQFDNVFERIIDATKYVSVRTAIFYRAIANEWEIVENPEDADLTIGAGNQFNINTLDVNTVQRLLL